MKTPDIQVQVINIEMSPRAYIATAALQGWAAGRNQEFNPQGESSHRERVAAGCVAYADALIAELENGAAK